MTSPRTYSAQGCAKVNLHLGVGEVREDGYHELATVFQSLDLVDVIHLQVRDGLQRVTASGPFQAGVPEDTSNLAWRAYEAVSRAMGASDGQVGGSIHIVKGIPAAGGMAGGSADAAAVLRVANVALAQEYEREPLPEEKLYELAAELGSDVPFTLMGGTALGLGRGEKLTPMLSRGQFIWAIITSAHGLSTPSVFHKLDELRAAGRGSQPHMDTGDIAQALISGEPTQLAAVLCNDLQAAALSLRPDLRKILDTGKNAGALQGIVSGSGPTCAFLCEDEETAQEVIAQVTADNRGTRGFVSRGPAPGAREIAESRDSNRWF